MFDAQHPANSSKPLVFDPTGKCPAFVVNPKIARSAGEKQHADQVEYAQLVKDNVSVAPIHSGLDGGMNKVFLAQFPGSIIPLARVLRLDLDCRNCHPSLGPTTMVRWRVNCLAPCSGRSPPHRRKWPGPIRQRRKAARIRRQPDRLPRRQQSPRRRLRPWPLRSRCPSEQA